MKTAGFDIGNDKGALISMEGGSSHLCMSPANSLAGMPTTAYIGKDNSIMIAEKSRRNEAFRVDTIKRCMQAGREVIRSDGKETRRAVSDDIYTEIVRALIDQGRSEIETIADDNRGGAGIGAVICYPSAFSDEPELLNRMKVAAEKAGSDIQVLGMIPESGAAGMAYLQLIRKRAEEKRGKLPEDVTIALLDIGGGTSDAAVVRARIEGTPYELLLHDGIRDFGGKDIDDIFYEDTLMSLKNMLKDTPLAPGEIADLRYKIIRAKEELSSQESYPITVNVGAYGDLHEHIVTRKRLEQLARGGIIRAMGLLEKMLDQAAAEKIKIDTIVLTGGVSRMPLVSECARELVREKKQQTPDGNELNVEIFDPSWSVAKGAAIYALSEKKAMEQRTRHNYSFRYANTDGTERYVLCVPYAKALPAKSEPVSMRRVGNRMEVSIAYDENGREIGAKEGEEVSDRQMKEFRRFYFDEASGEVTFAIDEDMMLTVTLKTKDGREIVRTTGHRKGERSNG